MSSPEATFEDAKAEYFERFGKVWNFMDDGATATIISIWEELLKGAPLPSWVKLPPAPSHKPKPDARFINDDGTVFGLEDLKDGDRGISPYAQRVNEACDDIGIKEIYDRISKGIYGSPDSGDEQQISCPNPEHPDKNPSASMNVAKDVFVCYKCYEKGTDKYAIAAHAWGYPVPIGKAFWEIKQRLALEFRGVEYEVSWPAPPAKVEPAPPAHTAAIQAEVSHVPFDPAPDPHEQDVQRELNRQRIFAEAKDRLRQERAGKEHTPFTLGTTLGQMLSEPKRENEWTIEGLHGLGTNTLIIGDLKSGKTTVVQNLLRSLADGEDLFGELPVRDLSGNIAYFNFEVDDDEMRERLERLNISKVDRILPVNLRSHRYDLLNAATFEQTVNQLHEQEVEVLVLDPWSRVNLSESENDNAAAMRYLQAIDALKSETGVVDIFIPAHSMKNTLPGAELTVRGASVVDGWADYRWLLYADSERKHFFKLGRSRRNDERLSKMRESTIGSDGLLRLDNSSAAVAAIRRMDVEVSAFVKANPGCVKGDVAKGVNGKRQAVISIIDRLVSNHNLVIDKIGNAHHCYLPEHAPTGLV